MAEKGRIQLHVELAYKKQPSEHPKIQSYLSNGYTIVSLVRVTDREALVTLEPVPVAQ